MDLMTYDVYLTESEQNDESSERSLIDGVDRATAEQMCLTLNEGGYLREGIEAHFIRSE
jgi:hypothetical protein